MNTFFWNLQFATLGNLDSLLWLIARKFRDILDLIDNLISFKDFAEDDMASIKPGGGDGGDEELAPVCVLARVGHAHKTLTAVLELEVLIRELGPVDGLSTGS